jgi:arylsulfatase A-like enzyme
MSKNIVYIHSHDTGRYISPYGHAIPTPNLLAFAEQSVLFRQAYTAHRYVSAYERHARSCPQRLRLE